MRTVPSLFKITTQFHEQSFGAHFILRANVGCCCPVLCDASALNSFCTLVIVCELVALLVTQLNECMHFCSTLLLYFS
jgi:hypothetical protein